MDFGTKFWIGALTALDEWNTRLRELPVQHDIVEEDILGYGNWRHDRLALLDQPWGWNHFIVSRLGEREVRLIILLSNGFYLIWETYLIF